MRWLVLLALLCPLAAAARTDAPLTGKAAYGDWRSDAPGVQREITAASMPRPYATPSAGQPPEVVARPPGAQLHVPPGFTVNEFAAGLDEPRTMRTAPNGDVFLAETGAGRIMVFRVPDGAPRPAQTAVFASGLSEPFGIAFWPPGANPAFVYVAEPGRVVRFAYRSGDLQASRLPQVVVPRLPAGRGHSTRDIVFSTNGRHMFVSVGSATNRGTDMLRKGPEAAQGRAATRALGAAWGDEQYRANVLEFHPDGKFERVYATGLRNCTAEAINPADGVLWCAVNERDGLGNDLPPDYATSVQQGAFYGWPWFYIGDHPDPALHGAPRGLRGNVTVPDVLIQPHSAPLGMTFYSRTQFPPAYRTDAFVALRGSWNRSIRTGYKVVRLLFSQGKPTGGYADFLTGFVVSDQAVWGRPVGLAVTHDGSLLVSEDGNGTIWRVSYHDAGGDRR